MKNLAELITSLDLKISSYEKIVYAQIGSTVVGIRPRDVLGDKVLALNVAVRIALKRHAAVRNKPSWAVFS